MYQHTKEQPEQVNSAAAHVICPSAAILELLRRRGKRGNGGEEAGARW